jgi:YD repeat-containing protein
LGFAGVIGAQSSYEFVHDELGRLVAIIDPAGETATYTYDAAGNVLSITRTSSSQVSVIEFTPNSGPIGAQVTIFGTAFGATPAQNTVKFNGVTASIISASVTRLVVNVPTGASTGTISVTAPGGTATSSAPFTVTASTAPTITGFTPAIGIPGTAVTLTGTNFSTSIPNDKVYFNTSTATVTSATATSMSCTAPGPTSGRISVITPNGQAVSTADFFVPPSPYVATDVDSTGRMSIGGSGALSVPTVNHIGLMVFDGTAGQKVSLQIASTVTTCAALKFLNPLGSTLANYTTCGTTGFVDPVILPETGTSTIVMDPSSSGVGGTTLTLYQVPPDPAATITPGGAPVAVTTTVPGQNAILTFLGTTGQAISLLTSANSIPGTLYLSILKPDGSSLVTQTSSSFIDKLILPDTGTYTVKVDPFGSGTGSVTLTLYDVPADAGGTITQGSPPVQVTTTVPGQNALLSFSGNTGDSISVLVQTETYPGSIFLAILKPDGTPLVPATTAGFIDRQTLPVSGTYGIFVDPSGSGTGSATLSLYAVPADFSGSLVPGGPPGTATISTPGQNANLTFEGVEGHRISLKISNSTVSLAYYTIFNPDDTILVPSTGFLGSSGFIDTRVLGATGTYRIFMDPYIGHTGTADLTLYDVPADVTGTLTPGGGAVPVTFGTPGQNGSFTFSGTNGQRISLQIANSTIGLFYVTLLDPSSGTVANQGFISSTGFLDTVTLPATGTYTLLVDPYDSNTGSANLTLHNVPADASGIATINGASVPINIPIPGQNGAVTFTGAASQQVTVRITGSTVGLVTVKLLRPDMTVMTSTSSLSSNFNLATQTLPSAGVYTITIDPSGANTGTMNVAVTNP